MYKGYIEQFFILVTYGLVETCNEILTDYYEKQTGCTWGLKEKGQFIDELS